MFDYYCIKYKPKINFCIKANTIDDIYHILIVSSGVIIDEYRFELKSDFSNFMKKYMDYGHFLEKYTNKEIVYKLRFYSYNYDSYNLWKECEKIAYRFITNEDIFSLLNMIEEKRRIIIDEEININELIFKISISFKFEYMYIYVEKFKVEVKR